MATSTVQKLLVAGYMRKVEKNHISLTIPAEINDIIYLYQRYCDQWDDEISSDDINIDEQSSIITIDDNEYCTAFGKHIVTQGIFVWRLKFVTVKRDGWHAPPYVGIMENNDKNIKQYGGNSMGLWERDGYQLCTGNSTLCGPSNEDHIITDNYQCLWTKQDDILEITLDLNQLTLSFKVNDKDYGIAFSNIRKTQYRLVLSALGLGGSQFALL